MAAPPTGYPATCLNSTGRSAPVAAMSWMDDGGDRLQADSALFVSLTPVVSDEVAPWVEDDTPREVAAQAGRATTLGGAAMVVVGGFGVVLTGPAGDLLASQPPNADAKTINAAPKMNS